MRVLGLDLSLNSPGFAIRDGADLHLWFFAQRKRERGLKWQSLDGRVRIVSLDFDTKWQKDAKIERIRSSLAEILDLFPVERAFVEDYAFNAATSSLTALAEVRGVVCNLLHQRRVEYTSVAPSSLKKGFAGRGGATKDDMLVAFVARGYPDIRAPLRIATTDNPVEDLVDAAALALRQ